MKNSKNTPVIVMGLVVITAIVVGVIWLAKGGDDYATNDDLNALTTRVEDLEGLITTLPEASIVTEPEPEPVLYCPQDGNPNTDNDTTNDPGGDAFPSYRECYEDAPVLAEDLAVNDEYCVVDDINGPLYTFVVIDSQLKTLGDITDEFGPSREADHQIIMVVPSNEVPDLAFVSVEEAGLGSTPSGNFTIQGACHDG